jgi:hypothetical protein
MGFGKTDYRLQVIDDSLAVDGGGFAIPLIAIKLR